MAQRTHLAGFHGIDRPQLVQRARLVALTRTTGLWPQRQRFFEGIFLPHTGQTPARNDRLQCGHTFQSRLSLPPHFGHSDTSLSSPMQRATASGSGRCEAMGAGEQLLAAGPGSARFSSSQLANPAASGEASGGGGIRIACRQTGHFTSLPANSSLARNRRPHLHSTAIVMIHLRRSSLADISQLR
jgi:hypothetical protein